MRLTQGTHCTWCPTGQPWALAPASTDVLEPDPEQPWSQPQPWCEQCSWHHVQPAYPLQCKPWSRVGAHCPWHRCPAQGITLYAAPTRQSSMLALVHTDGRGPVLTSPKDSAQSQVSGTPYAAQVPYQASVPGQCLWGTGGWHREHVAYSMPPVLPCLLAWVQLDTAERPSSGPWGWMSLMPLLQRIIYFSVLYRR